MTEFHNQAWRGKTIQVKFLLHQSLFLTISSNTNLLTIYNELNEVKKVEAENDIPLATSSPMLVAEQKTKMLGWPSTGLVHMYV